MARGWELGVCSWELVLRWLVIRGSWFEKIQRQGKLLVEKLWGTLSASPVGSIITYFFLLDFFAAFFAAFFFVAIDLFSLS